ncbi:MAG: NADP-dependent phosphogluconate dehydrogenase [Firmicutes bacterium]|jgi:6-phosphogluconate dehydrogenase|nr:NADP-dependent phosphogluconate dehydrogenase [Bacillota bacterium]
MAKADVGLIGLAVMGQNLALNMASKGYTVAVWNRTAQRTERFVADKPHERIRPAYTLRDLVDLLDRPRRIMLMVQAGSAVDAILAELIPLLAPNDVVLDGGNSHFCDTIRRDAMLRGHGVHFIGAGISGGEEGALKGPSIMPGGDRTAWEIVSGLLTDIAAKVDDEPCCTYLGTDGAGHFVKMVHNGIEYANMQLIAEIYMLMKELLGLSASQMREVFQEWNRGELRSYLVEITAGILGVIDEHTGCPLIEMIADQAEQKGTGKWSIEAALDLGVPVPTMAEAVLARFISARKQERAAAAALLPGPESTRASGIDVNALGDALYVALICSYAQGFALMRQAAAQYRWDLDLGEVARIWRGGCIIRAGFLDRIREAYRQAPSLPNLLVDEYFRRRVSQRQTALRRTVVEATLRGLPVPGLASACAYYDSYRKEVLPANLIQAQRDFFGAHTYRRTDKDGVFHTDWKRAIGREES